MALAKMVSETVAAPSSRLALVRRQWATGLAAAALALLLATMAAAIVLSQQQSEARILSNFRLRGTSSATFVSTYLDEQAAREQQAARPFLQALVDHTIPYRQHQVFLVDGAGRLLAASPRTAAGTLAAADPPLARAAKRSTLGAVPGAARPTTFTAAPVPGTAWRLLIAIPDSRLYTSIAGASSTVPWVVFALVAVLGALLVALFGRSLADRARLAQLSRTLETTARTDSLTGLCNRRALGEHLTRAAATARRRVEPLSVLMIDLDRFKETNDAFGHDAGDRVLCTLADCLRDVIRGEDICGRWGGDEFLVVLPHASDAGARKVAQRIRAAAADVDLSDIGLEQGVPLSVGAATGVHTNPHDLVRAADVALYRSKASGRGEVRSTTHR
jgi:diguanylate cyclase (GGDEF)-like protein